MSMKKGTELRASRKKPAPAKLPERAMCASDFIWNETCLEELIIVLFVFVLNPVFAVFRV